MSDNKARQPDVQGSSNGRTSSKKGKGKKTPQTIHPLSIQRSDGDTLSLNTVKSPDDGCLIPMTGNTNPIKSKKSVKLKQRYAKKGKSKKNKGRNRGKKGKKSPNRDTLLTLLSFPKYVENSESAAILLLLVFLSQVFHLLAEPLAPFPILMLCVSPLIANSVIGPLLIAIQGPEEWSGKHWRLKRPWVIGPKNSFVETKLSVRIIEYLGGIFKNSKGKWREFYFPFIGSSALLMPGLPLTVSKQIINISPLAMPILINPMKLDSVRPIIELKSQMFDSYDVEGIRMLNSSARNCYTLVVSFLSWFRKGTKNIWRWRESVDSFRPVTRRGRFSQLKTDDRTEFLCAALAFLKQFLRYAYKIEAWITQEDAEEILLWYWRTVLPESAPQNDSNTQGGAVKLKYDTPETFYRFLTEYFLPVYREQVRSASSGAPGTMGLLHTIGKKLYFITPRMCFLELYARWLEDHDATVFDPSAHNGEAAVQRKLQDTGVPLKGESANPATWRFKFYSEGDKVSCLALPLSQLPETVQNVFGQLFEIPSEDAVIPNVPEAVPDGQEGVNCL